MTTSILEAALLYASRGWPVFPCHPNAKVPIVQRGFYSATTAPDVVREMFARPANVAIVTGQASGFYVVDVDDPSSPFVASLPPTLVASTPRGGWHYYYRTTVPLKSSVNKLAHKIDTRGDGGYVVAPPSMVDGRVYQWANNLDAALLPQFVIDALAKADPPPKPAPTAIVVARGTTTYGMRALVEECDALRAAEEGTRNNALNRAAFKVAQLVAGGSVDEGEARAHLIDAALACGLEERETERTIDSGFRGGLAHPRVPSQRPDPLEGMSFAVGEHERPPENMRRRRKQHQDAAQWELLSRVMSLGGLAQSFPEWVINTARYPQPGLTIGATIALGSVLGARRYVFRGLTSSSYICAVANTGGGKGHPQTCLTSLLRGHWSGVIGPSDLSSTASTIERIGTAAAAGTGILFVLDEYGPRLKTLLDAHSSHQRETRALLLSLATIGTGDYAAATSLARGGDDKIIRVPGLSIYGSSTPQSLHDAIGRMALDDGLTGRHLFFNELNTLPTRARGVTSEPPPEDLVAFLDSIRDAHVAWDKSLPR